VTSPAVNMDVFTLEELRDIMAQLSNLDDLSSSGSHFPLGPSALLGIGTALGGRLGGRLVLCEECTDKDAMNVSLEIPTVVSFRHLPKPILSAVGGHRPMHQSRVPSPMVSLRSTSVTTDIKALVGSAGGL